MSEFSSPKTTKTSSAYAKSDGRHVAIAGISSPSHDPDDILQSKESRISARQARIQSSREQKMRIDQNEEAGQNQRINKMLDPSENSKSQRQITQSRQRIDHARRAVEEDITSVRVAAVSRESRRRNEDTKRSESIKHTNQECADVSDELATEVQQKWEEALKLNGPYELYEMLLKQKVVCDNLIAAKDKLISEYAAESRKKDDDYVKELKRQAEEINELLHKMDVQYRDYQQVLREELDQVEKAFMEERTDLVEKNVKEIDMLFEQRRASERRYIEERPVRIDDGINQLEEQRTQDAEEYHLIKIRLETDVQILEQQLQQMRATYQLNTEKLEYNFQVLKKRDEENTVTINQQKRKITRLTDVNNGLKSKAAKQEKLSRQELVTLIEDNKRITEQFNDLQKKFRSFQNSDDKKYHDIWEMNEESVRELIRRVLQADQIIHEQQLGQKWSPPAAADIRFLKSRHISDSPNKSSESDPATDDTVSISITSRLFRKRNRITQKLIDLLSSEATFLVADKLLKILQPLSQDEQKLLKVDSIFQSLKITTIDHIASLLKHCMKTAYHGLIDLVVFDLGTEAGELSVDEEFDNAGARLEDVFVHPDEVVKQIGAFMEELKKASSEKDNRDRPEDTRGKGDEMAGAETSSTSTNQNEGSPGSNIIGDDSEKAKQYWEKLSNVIDEKNYRIWNSVLNAMEQYHLLLVNRHNLNAEVESLQQQNHELKLLLGEYMNSDVNNALEIPPSRIFSGQYSGMSG
ncbi:sperm tail-domain-containing protein [Paraphysoderma sedebokerense]|nr:sperm tail-domain-containing protein [Paraphysoderma sedebokerense]